MHFDSFLLFRTLRIYQFWEYILWDDVLNRTDLRRNMLISISKRSKVAKQISIEILTCLINWKSDMFLKKIVMNLSVLDDSKKKFRKKILFQKFPFFIQVFNFFSNHRKKNYHHQYGNLFGKVWMDEIDILTYIDWYWWRINIYILCFFLVFFDSSSMFMLFECKSFETKIPRIFFKIIIRKLFADVGRIKWWKTSWYFSNFTVHISVKLWLFWLRF